jgi:hydroxymethylbilane synthase
MKSSASREFTFKLGTRASALALVQAHHVARLLKRAHPKLKVELVKISTTGDQQTDKTLKSFGGAGVFVTELEQALRDKRIDAAVHSLKDMPTALPRGLQLAAVLGREKTNDVAIVKDGLRLEDLPAGAVIGTGSERRRAQLKIYYPHLAFAEIRGNVETRLKKVAEGQYAATILAMAGLRRLKLLKKSMQILPLEAVLPAPGQGALGLECRGADARVRKLLEKIHNPEVMLCAGAERTLLAMLGGGCHLPLGALCSIEKGSVRLQCFLGLPDGTRRATVDVRCPFKGKAVASAISRRIAGLAHKQLLAQGSRDILKQLNLTKSAVDQTLT